MYKRYQRFGPKGIEWSPWFKIQDNAEQTKWQLKNVLKNEYKEKLDAGDNEV